jgi:hypothetical protein
MGSVQYRSRTGGLTKPEVAAQIPLPGLALSDKQYDQGDGKRRRRDEVRKAVVDHAVDFGGTAIFSLSSVQVLRTSAVISVQFSI